MAASAASAKAMAAPGKIPIGRTALRSSGVRSGSIVGVIRLAVVALLAVELGAGFGPATATVVSTTDESMIVDLHVEVVGPADSVVVHLALADEDPITLPMVPRDDGSYGVTTEVKVADYQVVFETLGESGIQSDPVAISDLGVDLSSEPGAAPTTTEVPERSPGTQRWLWLGVALGAASLSALAFWVLGDRDDPEDDIDDLEESPPSSSKEETPES
jgi:hypothetical protein